MRWGNFTAPDQTRGAFAAVKNQNQVLDERWSSPFALLPKASPVPVTVCLGGNVLLPSKLHWGNLETGVAQQQRPCKSTGGAERRREGGRQEERQHSSGLIGLPKQRRRTHLRRVIQRIGKPSLFIKSSDSSRTWAEQSLGLSFCRERSNRRAGKRFYSLSYRRWDESIKGAIT